MINAVKLDFPVNPTQQTTLKLAPVALLLVLNVLGALLWSQPLRAQEPAAAASDKTSSEQDKLKPNSASSQNQNLSSESKTIKTIWAEETVWIEETVTPATRWLEGAVQPLTIWMEKKIHRRSKKRQAHTEPAPQIAVARPQTADATLVAISQAQAATIANKRQAGEVLRTSLLAKTPPQYRVKLISPNGEIHLIYIHAQTGKILKSN